MSYHSNLSFGPETRIVLVGTSRCDLDRDMLPPVPHAERNINHLATIFTNPEICGLDEKCIIKVLDKANANEIIEEIARAAQEATDTLLVYYVGHGLYGDSENAIYLAAGKTTEGNKAFNAVQINLVRQAIRMSRARKRILILDCCYSGRALEGTLAAHSAETTVTPALDLEGTFGIAAVPGNAKALAPPGEKFTRFTGALIDVLEKGCETKEKFLTIEDVFREVERKIWRKGDSPLPKKSNWDRGEKFVFALNRYQNQPELDNLFNMINELKEAQIETDARLKALEERSQDNRVALDQSTHYVNSATRDDKTAPRTSIFLRRLDLTENEWKLLPVTYRLHLQKLIHGKIVSERSLFFITLMGLLHLFNSSGLIDIIFASTPVFYFLKGAVPLSSILLFIFSIFPLCLVVSFRILYRDHEEEFRKKLFDHSVSTEADFIIKNNDLIFDAMTRRTIPLFGILLDEALIIGAWLVAIFSVGLSFTISHPEAFYYANIFK